MASVRRESSLFLPLLLVGIAFVSAALLLCFAPFVDCPRCDASGVVDDEAWLWICPQCGGDGGLSPMGAMLDRGSEREPREGLTQPLLPSTD